MQVHLYWLYTRWYQHTAVGPALAIGVVMLNEVTNRLDEIVERNHKSQIVDAAFAAMIVALMILCIVSLQSSTGLFT